MSLQLTIERLMALRAEVCAVIDAALDEIRAHAGDLNACPLPRVRVIQEVVSAWYGVPVSVLQAQSRMREYVLPRHVAMYLTRMLTKHSGDQVAHCFDRKDHATVSHAVRSIQNRMDIEPEFRAEVRQLWAQAEERLGGLDMPLFRRAVG